MRMHWINQFYHFFIKNPSSKIHLVFLYRVVSLFLTSLFFLFGLPTTPLVLKLVIIISLCVASWIVTDLQKKHLHSKKILQMIVLTEIIGLTLLLLPTGGIDSPFFWYALNPVLVAASFLSPFFCWGILSFYLGIATFIANFNSSSSVLYILRENSSIYLVCLLITFLVMLYSGLTKELDLKASILKVQQEELLVVNRKLYERNDLYKETLEHIMSLYQLMESFSANESVEKLTKDITLSLKKCTQQDAVFFWISDLNRNISYISNTTNIQNIEQLIKHDWHIVSQNKNPMSHLFHNDLYWVRNIRTSKFVGLLGMKVNTSQDDKRTFLFNRTFEFIADLSEFMLERIHLDQTMNQLILIEEQNRIANEIHDNVSQKLFSIVYSLHSLQAKSNQLSQEQLNEEYDFLSKTANSTMKELRAAIYRLSSVKKSEVPFFLLIKNYLEEYSRLNNIKINYQFSGNESFYQSHLKIELYRIICEACGNSVRHGECTKLDIKLDFLEDKISLIIQDNGIGIVTDKVEKESNGKGIGLINIKNIVYSFGGTFSIKSNKSKGTVLAVSIPNITATQAIRN